MLKAFFKNERGELAIILGLSAGNVRLLREAQPIVISLAEIGVPQGGQLLIMFGETEQAILAELKTWGVDLAPAETIQ